MHIHSFVVLCMKKIKKIEISVEQEEELKQRISASNLSEADREVMVNLLEFSSWMQSSLMEAKLSINRLKKLFGFSTEKKKIKN